MLNHLWKEDQLHVEFLLSEGPEFIQNEVSETLNSHTLVESAHHGGVDDGSLESPAGDRGKESTGNLVHFLLAPFLLLISD